MKNGARTVISVLAGLVAFVALFPFSGDDSDPPSYHSVFGYDVPTGGVWLALGAGLIVGVLVWTIVGKAGRSDRGS